MTGRRHHPTDEHVVLLDPSHRVVGTAPKLSAHHRDTPLHLGFSCYVVDGEGRVLLTQRASSKRTWPDTWTNACCGHPQLGETLREAVERRLDFELGVTARAMALALPHFRYRAAMGNGIVEHELCPVVVATIDGAPCPNPQEVSHVAWTSWDRLRGRAEREPATLSPWSVEQIHALARGRLDGPDAPGDERDPRLDQILPLAAIDDDSGR